MDLVLVGLGGFFGAIARRALDLAVSERVEGAFPLGTLVVNLTGSFLLGLLFAWAIERDVLPADVRGPLLIGFLGAYTTFSTFTYETIALVRQGELGLALVNVLGSAGVGIAGCGLGVALGQQVAGWIG